MRPSTRTVRLLGAVAVGAGLLVGDVREAHAQGPGPASYFVVTNDGSRYQGELVESLVGGHTTIRLATGEILVFEPRDVTSQGPLGTPAPVVVAPPPPEPPPPPKPRVSLSLPDLHFGGAPTVYDGPDAVHVHITSSNEAGARLAQESSSGWVPVCAIPCTTSVDPKAMYQLQTTPGLMVPSAPFHFPGDRGALDLTATVNSRLHNMGWGIGLVTGGPLVALPGIFLVSGMFDGTSAGGAPGSPSTAETVVGWTLVGASAALTIAGVVMLVTPASTTMTDSNGHRVAKQGVQLTPTGLLF